MCCNWTVTVWNVWRVTTQRESLLLSMAFNTGVDYKYTERNYFFTIIYYIIVNINYLLNLCLQIWIIAMPLSVRSKETFFVPSQNSERYRYRIFLSKKGIKKTFSSFYNLIVYKNWPTLWWIANVLSLRMEKHIFVCIQLINIKINK